jgi:hypothetical protein
MKDHPQRWMQMAWAREIRDLCVDQEVAFFFKQDSAARTETRPYLVEEDGSRWTWAQYPDNMKPAVNIDTGETRSTRKEYDLPDHDLPWSIYEQPSRPTRVVSFRQLIQLALL